MSIGRQAALLTTGNLLAQVCQLAALPFIAGYADPAAFGIYTLFVGACSIASIFAGMRYESAIVVASTDRQSRLLSALVLLLGVASAVLLPSLVVVLTWIFEPGQISTMRFMAWFAAGYIATNTAFRVTSSWFNRLRWFGLMGAQQFVLVAGTIAVQIAFLRDGVPPVKALVQGALAGQAFVAAWPVALWLVQRRPFPRTAPGLLLLAVARKFSAFPRYMIAYGLNSTVRERLIQIVFGWGAGATSLGSFAMAQRLSSAPHLLIHGGVGPALLGFARQSTKAEVARAACLLIEFAALLLIPIFVFVIANGPALVATFFGNRWSGLGAYLQILAIPALVVASSAFVDRLFELYGHQRKALALELGYSVAALCSLVAVGTFGSGLAMATSYAVLLTLYHLYYMYRSFVINDLPRDHIRSLLLRVFIQFAFFCIVNLLLQGVGELWIRGLVACLAAAASYAIYYLWFGGRISVLTLFAQH